MDSEIPSPYDGVLLEILVPGARPSRSAPCWPGSASPAPAGGGRPAAGHPGRAARPRRGAPAGRDRRPRRRPTVTAGCSPRWSADWSPRPGWTSRRSPAPAWAAGSGGRTSRRRIATGGARPAAPAAAPRRRRRRLRPAPAPLRPPAAKPRPCRPAAADPRDQVVKLSRMRLAVAGGMKASLDALARRCGPPSRSTSTTSSGCAQKHKDRFKKETGASLSYLPFVSRATIDALRAYPTVNSSIDIEAKTMTLHPYVNLGIAVDLDQQGLVVPVVKDADGAEHARHRQADHRTGRRGAGEEAGDGGHAGLDLHHHQPGPVRQLRLVADHQPAQRRRSCAPTG